MASAWMRWAPSFTNISPAADFPLAIPPVRPIFSKGTFTCDAKNLSREPKLKIFDCRLQI